MIEIDGSFGEGGGQILRTSTALSSVTHQPVRIKNIRASRKNPGLAPSHVTSVEAVAAICDAETEGVFVGSKEIVFRPGELVGGDFDLDVGTAGSISLVLQSCLIPSVVARTRTRLVIKGGTDVNWSPPIDHMRLVHLPLLERFGPSCHLELLSRGFYPEGGGEVSVEVSPVARLDPVDLSSRGAVLRIEGVAYAQNLPETVVTRIKHSALKSLVEFERISVDSDIRKGHSTGAGLVLAAVCQNTVIGESTLGAKGLRSEVLGETTALNLIEVLRSGATVDEHMLDQILPYMALASGPSVVLAEELTGHAETNIWVIERFLGKRFAVDKTDGLVRVQTV